MTDDVPPPQASEFFCPHCGQSLGSSDAAAAVMICPGCGQQVSLSPVEGADDVIAEDDASTNDEPADGDLSGLKIRQISALRRGAYRTRSWLMIAAIACIVGAAQLIFLAARAHRIGQQLAPLGDILVAIVALLLCLYFARRAAEVNREIQQSRLEEPTTPPDFSTLRDGSQRWTNLEAMNDDLSEN
jgi:hypothetical protein